MRTAKTLFQSSPAYKDFQAILTNPAFEPACHAAIASLVENLPGSATEPTKAWDSYLKILGAREVLEIFSRLHEPDKEPKQTPWPALKYEAKPNYRP